MNKLITFKISLSLVIGLTAVLTTPLPHLTWLAQAAGNVYVNQVGYLPTATKIIVTDNLGTSTFQVINESTEEVVFNGPLVSQGSDFGNFKVGNFSGLQTHGTYYVEAGGATSYSFDIGPDIYDSLLRETVRFCEEQRCGYARSWHPNGEACHLDDALRQDNQQHVDATGGWHEAHNVQKQGGGMSSEQLLGLAHIKEVLNPSWGGEIMEEINWGNDFFHKIVSPQGYKYEHRDPEPIISGNSWTDNVVGTADDRVLGTDPPHNSPTLPGFDYYPWSFAGQFVFVASQAISSRLGAENASECLEIAKEAYNYSKDKFPHNSFTLGTYIFASIELYLATGESTYKTQAVQKADELLALQEKTWHGGPDNGLRGFFYLDAARDEIPEYITFWLEGYPLIALTRLLEVFPEHSQRSLWQEALRLHSEDYLLRTSSWNAFGQIAKEIYTEADPAGRKIGDLWYRYFFRHAFEDFGNYHRQGANAASALYTVGLTKAARLLNNPALRVLAQRQIDWLLGANPVGDQGICSVTGFGYENFGTTRGASLLNYPQIDGGVANGLSGTIDTDQPMNEANRNHNVSSNEYWVVNEGTFQWALAEIIADPGVPLPRPGDANGDGQVNDQDLDLLIQDYLQLPTHNTDFNSDGRVDIKDFAVLSANYGNLGN